MQKNIFAKILLLIFCFNSACSSNKTPPYILSHILTIQPLEKTDHRFCSSLKLDFDKTDDIKSTLYWRCRLSIVKYRLIPNPQTPADKKFNLEINDLITKISLKISATPESAIYQANKQIDNLDHNQCLRMGFKVFTDNQTKIDDYFGCRRVLMVDRKLLPPFGNVEYFKYPNNKYNLSFIVDQRVEQQIELYKEAAKAYPKCAKFNLYGEDFKRCKTAYDNSRKCYLEINRKKFKKEAEKKIACQRKTYIRFPDSFLKEKDRQKQAIAKHNTRSDYYNQQSFASIGIEDISQFDSDEKRANKMKEKKKQKEKNINSKDELYDKFELTKLRKKYVVSCQKEADEEIAQYLVYLNKECEDMKMFEILGED